MLIVSELSSQDEITISQIEQYVQHSDGVESELLLELAKVVPGDVAGGILIIAYKEKTKCENLVKLKCINEGQRTYRVVNFVYCLTTAGTSVSLLFARSLLKT